MARVIPERVQERVLDNVAMGPNGCHISTYAASKDGYARVGWHDLERGVGHIVGAGAHRVAWTARYGQIPDGMTVHHRCFTPRCVNPDHLELLTNVENARRQKGTRELPADGSCVRGHGPELWVVVQRRTNGRPIHGCRECRRDYTRARRARLAASGGA